LLSVPSTSAFIGWISVVRLRPDDRFIRSGIDAWGRARQAIALPIYTADLLLDYLATALGSLDRRRRPTAKNIIGRE